MNMFARFDENPAMTLRVIKETKRYGRTDARTDNVKTVYPLQTKFAGGIKKIHLKMKVLEWSQHFSHYKSMGIFPNAQGQLTHKSLVGSCRISNPFEILWLSLLPARIKKNTSKMKELEWSQDFSHYNPMGAICCQGNQR